MKKLINEFTIVLGILVLLIIAAYTSPCDGATLAYYNLDGCHTSLHVVNSASSAIPWGGPKPCRVGPCQSFDLGPFQTAVFPDAFPPASGGVYDIAVPGAAAAYSEFVDPAGGDLRIPALATFSVPAQVQDFSADPRTQTFVFVACNATCRVSWFRDAAMIGFLDSSGVSVTRAPSTANRAVVSSVPGVGPAAPLAFSLFAYNRQAAAPFAFQSVIEATVVK